MLVICKMMSESMPQFKHARHMLIKVISKQVTFIALKTMMELFVDIRLVSSTLKTYIKIFATSFTFQRNVHLLGQQFIWTTQVFFYYAHINIQFSIDSPVVVSLYLQSLKIGDRPSCALLFTWSKNDNHRFKVFSSLLGSLSSHRHH